MPTITIYCNITELESTNMVQEKDSPRRFRCKRLPAQRETAHLAEEVEPCTGMIVGANGPIEGAITSKGFVNFMGVKI